MDLKQIVRDYTNKVEASLPAFTNEEKVECFKEYFSYSEGDYFAEVIQNMSLRTIVLNEMLKDKDIEAYLDKRVKEFTFEDEVYYSDYSDFFYSNECEASDEWHEIEAHLSEREYGAIAEVYDALFPYPKYDGDWYDGHDDVLQKYGNWKGGLYANPRVLKDFEAYLKSND